MNGPLHYGDDSGSIDIDSTVSFKTHPKAGKATMDNIKGNKASSGMFEVELSRADLQPRAKGYLTGVFTAGPTDAKVCATPDGNIYISLTDNIPVARNNFRQATGCPEDY